jgi:hypothetical protein
LYHELKEKEKQIVIVLSEKEQLKNSLTKSDNKIAELNSQLSTMDNNLSQLNIDIETKQKELEEERQKIIIITRERDSQSHQLSALKDDFGSLKVKYDKLIKPARSTKGKYTVTVDYERIKGKERIRFKDSADSDYTQVTEKQLHQKLAKLKKKYPESLYVRIIIPEKSGLTYNEAWTFMIDILKKYDYYYQD